MSSDIYNISYNNLKNFVIDNGGKSYITDQIFVWLYVKFVSSFQEMTNISKQFREILSNHFHFSSLTISHSFKSYDNTTKIIIQTPNNHNIESVFIPETRRNTLCISSQIGCKFNCSYCVTGMKGFVRNLSVSEIINQLILIQKFVGLQNRISHIVFMGMGEPLDNFSNVMQSIKILTDSKSFNLPNKRVTLSTCGVVDKLNKLSTSEIPFNLAISLNAVNDNIRNSIMPVNKKSPLKVLFAALHKLRFKNRLHLTFEYIMIKNINMSENEAEALAKIGMKFNARINLIPLNYNNKDSFVIPDNKEINDFYKIVKRYYNKVTVRNSRGADIFAACGQLMK